MTVLLSLVNNSLFVPLLRRRVAYLFSGGRAKHNRLLLEALGSSYQGVLNEPPDIEIDQRLIDVYYTRTKHLPGSDLVAGWLMQTEEGRPGDWFYNASGPVVELARDIKRIAILKLRPLFLDLVNAHQHKIPFIERLACTRDTGQVRKLRGVDQLNYQSHPGKDLDAQKKQARELIEESEYGVFLTVTVVMGGRFGTRTLEEIHAVLNSLRAAAYNQVPTIMIQGNSKFVVYPLVHFAFFQIPHDLRFRESNHVYINRPGGLNFDERSIIDCLKVRIFTTPNPNVPWKKDYQAVHHLTGDNANITFAELFEQGSWIVYLGSNWEFHGDIWNFERVREGLAPKDDFEKAVSYVTGLT